MVVKIENLVKRYGDLVALDHFNLEIEEGEVFGKEMTPTSYESKRNIGVIMQNVAVLDEFTTLKEVSLVKLVEPPCTERDTRWCERSKIPYYV